jgi:hypothetical protein
MVDLHTQLRVEKQVLKDNLQDEATRAACKECTARPQKRPNLLTLTTCSRLTSIVLPTPVLLEMPEGHIIPSQFILLDNPTQEVQMIIDKTLNEGNSPTPKADIPLGPTNQLTGLLEQIANLLKPLNACLKSLEANEQYHLKMKGEVHTNKSILNLYLKNEYYAHDDNY